MLRILWDIYIYSPKCLFGKKGSQNHNGYLENIKKICYHQWIFLPQSDTQRKFEILNDLKIKGNNKNTLRHIQHKLLEHK